ncbi:DUF6318 family protein [Serinicoccus chungangensis]|uniref:DUF6318 family protein n=1 Tax=Serinicoccus chungangensis TaxID=767452 RepID=UPI0011192780|nr:DUF6318 family protein [Serinicoccus chungangensis]
MRRTAIIAAAASLVLLPACTESNEPSPMPTSEDALTTATESPEEPDDVAVTSEPDETAEETEEPAAEGPPEMPAEAEEQTEEGAVAFALHYIEVLNSAMTRPEVGLLEPLALDSCATCDNFEELIAYGAGENEYLARPMVDTGEPQSIFTGETARVLLPAEQTAQPFLRDGDPVDRALEQQELSLVVRVSWQDGWLVESITID